MNNQWILARTPTEGLPVAEDFRWVSSEIPAAGPQQMLTKTVYLSLDPYQWGRRRRGEELPGEVCHGRTVSQVLHSNVEGFEAGDFIFNTNGWQEYALTGLGISNFGYMYPRKLDPQQFPLSTALGVMGMLGLTAYSGLMLQCKPQSGETVIVSAASGGVGQVACQLAKIAGCRVIGIASTTRKLEFLTDVIGVDDCVSHLSENFEKELQYLCPDGCDIYFENVGGKVFEAVLPLLNRDARISVCGLVSQYSNTAEIDPRSAWKRIGRQIFDQQNVQIHDLFVGNFVDQYQSKFLVECGEYVSSGRVIYKEDRWNGLEKAPEAFASMMTGGNFGKTLIEVAEDQSQIIAG